MLCHTCPTTILFYRFSSYSFCSIWGGGGSSKFSTTEALNSRALCVYIDSTLSLVMGGTGGGSGRAASPRGECRKDYVQLLRTALGGNKPVSGSTIARLVNQYNPQYDVPCGRQDIENSRYLNEELCELLLDDRRASAKYHLQTDKSLKTFLQLVSENKHIMRT